MKQREHAFSELYHRSLEFIQEVAPTSDIRPLEHILGPLQCRIESLRERFAEETVHLDCRLRGSIGPHCGVHGTGLNTVGMLSDRLSILAIKQTRLRSGGGVAKATLLFETQTLDILTALSVVCPGNAAISTKITTLPNDARASNWRDAYFGLLSTNLLLWEAQEILYLRDISLLPPDELRSYIQWFAVGNMRRNHYIELCERLYWEARDDELGAEF